jgi:hypothetical protein
MLATNKNILSVLKKFKTFLNARELCGQTVFIKTLRDDSKIDFSVCSYDGSLITQSFFNETNDYISTAKTETNQILINDCIEIIALNEKSDYLKLDELKELFKLDAKCIECFDLCKENISYNERDITFNFKDCNELKEITKTAGIFSAIKTFGII